MNGRRVLIARIRNPWQELRLLSPSDTSAKFPICLSQSSTLFSSYIQWNDSQAEFKRQYLLGISMPYGPAFRQLSFIYNKVSGNILDREEWHQNYLIRFGRHRSMSLGKHPLLVRPSIIDPSPSVFWLRSLDVSAASPRLELLDLSGGVSPLRLLGACLIEKHVKDAPSLSMVLLFDPPGLFPDCRI